MQPSFEGLDPSDAAAPKRNAWLGPSYGWCRAGCRGAEARCCRTVSRSPPLAGAMHSGAELVTAWAAYADVGLAVSTLRGSITHAAKGTSLGLAGAVFSRPP